MGHPAWTRDIWGQGVLAFRAGELLLRCRVRMGFSSVTYFRVFWRAQKAVHWALCFVKPFQQQEGSQESLIQSEEGAEHLRFNYSLWDKLWIQGDWCRGLFPRREQPFMSGGFAQRLTVIICHSNYLLHDLFFVCYMSHLLRALLLTPPSAHGSNQLIITPSKHWLNLGFGMHKRCRGWESWSQSCIRLLNRLKQTWAICTLFLCGRLFLQLKGLGHLHAWKAAGCLTFLILVLCCSHRCFDL